MRTRPDIQILIIGFSILMGLISASSAIAQIRINEFMADNSTISDPDFGKFGDWIELYNAGSSSVDISGFGLTDDPLELRKWVFPEGSNIPSGGFLLVWADNDNTGLHTNFALNKSGEKIILADPNQNIVDSLSFYDQIENVSYGRKTDGASAWVFFSVPTPGTTNSGSSGDLVSAYPKPSHSSGFYNEFVTLTLEQQSSTAVIYYTRDGSEPDVNSLRYRNPIRLDTTCVIRAVQMDEGYLPSPVLNRTFVLNESSKLPVFSIITDPDNLWDEDQGIYVEGRNYEWGWGNGNFWQDWEKPCYVEFWEGDRDMKISQGAALKITGALTRTASQKSLRLIAKGPYGPKKFDYRFFKDKDITSYNDIVLRSSGNDWGRTMMADGMMATVVAGQMDIDYQAYRPAILYLNGQYWGIHNIREKVGDDYIEENHGFSKDNLDFLSQTDDIREGDYAQYNSLLNYIKQNNLTDPTAYAYVKERIDIQEYINYYVTQIFYANHDWPAGNIKYWRPRKDPSKWRWILFDTDLAFQKFYLNTMEWVTDPNPTYVVENDLFIGLMKSPEFQKQFIDTYQYHMATTFAEDRLTKIIDSLQEGIRQEIGRHIERWYGYHGYTFLYEGTLIKAPWLSSVDEWENYVDLLKTFAKNRPDYLNNYVSSHFGFGDPVVISMEVMPDQQGKVWINSDKATQSNLQLTLFKNQIMSLQAVPNVNTTFDEWVISSGFYDIGDLVPLVSKESEWKYLDTGVFPGQAWITNGFNDSDWLSGKGVLGYNNENITTPISFGDNPNAKHVASWFRKKFSINRVSDWSAIQIDLLRDDGAIVYLNGQELLRSNMAADADHRSLALSGVDASEENKYFKYEFPANKLINGENIIAVQIHQILPESSDLGFDLALRGVAAVEVGEVSTYSDEIIEFTVQDKIHYAAHFNVQNNPLNLYINEVMASNFNSLITPYGRTPDWVEIYNPNDFPVDLGGLYITDNLLNPDKHQIPTNQPGFTIVPAGGFKVLLASGQPLYSSEYLDFQFTSEGEEIGLYLKSGGDFILIDSLFYPPLSTNVSYGRYPDGADEWHAFSESPTPGSANRINNQVIPDDQVFLLQNYPNPFKESTSIVFGTKSTVDIRIEIRNIHGQLIKVLTDQEWISGTHEIIWNGLDSGNRRVQPGLYICLLRSGFYYDSNKMIFLR